MRAEFEYSSENTKAEFHAESGGAGRGGAEKRSLSISFDSSHLPSRSLRKSTLEVMSTADQLLETEVTVKGDTSKGAFKGWYKVMGGGKTNLRGKYSKPKSSYNYPSRFEFTGSWLNVEIDRERSLLGLTSKMNTSDPNSLLLWSYKTESEGDFRGESTTMWKYKTDMFMDKTSQMYNFINSALPFGTFSTQSALISIENQTAEMELTQEDKTTLDLEIDQKDINEQIFALKRSLEKTSDIGHDLAHDAICGIDFILFG